MWFDSISLQWLIFCLISHNYIMSKQVEGCSLPDIFVYIANFQLLTNNSDDVLVTSSNGTCYLFNVVDQSQMGPVTCDDYLGQTKRFSVSDGDATATNVLSVSYGRNVSAFDDSYVVDIHINMSRNGETVGFIVNNTALKSNFSSDSIRFVYFTINNWNTTIILYQTFSMSDFGCEYTKTHGVGIQFNSQDNNDEYVVTYFNVSLDCWTIHSSDSGSRENVFQDFNLVDLDMQVDSCDSKIYSVYNLNINQAGVITGLTLAGVSDNLKVDLSTNRGYNWVGHVYSDYIKTYTFNKDDEYVTFSRQNYHFNFSYDYRNTDDSSEMIASDKAFRNAFLLALTCFGLCVMYDFWV